MKKSENIILHKLNSLVRQNIQNASMSNDFLCHEIGLSRSQLHRILKQETQLSLSHYIRRQRLDKAKDLLVNTRLRISEIADAVGINSHQNFTTYFKAAFQLNPTEYRMQKAQKKSTILNLRENTIAVLPFVNFSNDIEQEYFSDGITEEIINVLSQVPALKVVGRTSSFAFKNKNDDLKSIGESLGVSYILEGSIRKAGQKVRITAQLIKASDGYQLWSQKYDCALNDIFQVQDEISAAILEEIKDELLGGMSHKVVKRKERDPEAYEYYLKGLYCLNEYSNSENFRRAINFFEQALKIEPDYVACLIEIASCHIQLWFFSQIDAAESIEKASKLIDRAYELAPDMASIKVRDAHYRTWHTWDIQYARELLEQALVLTPHNSEAHMHLGVVKTYMGEYESAEASLLEGIAIDPLSSILQYSYAWLMWYQNDIDRCEQIADQLISFKPDFWGGHYFKGIAYLETHRSGEALEYGEQSVALYPSSITYCLVAQTHLLNANFKEALDIAAKIEAQIDQFPVSNFDLGHLFMGLGQFEKSSKYFQKGLEDREGRMLFLLPSSRRLKGIQSLPFYKPIFDYMKTVQKM